MMSGVDHSLSESAFEGLSTNQIGWHEDLVLTREQPAISHLSPFPLLFPLIPPGMKNPEDTSGQNYNDSHSHEEDPDR